MRSKAKPIAPCTRDFSRASSELQVIARKCDWFIALFAPVVIGRSNCFGFGFSTVIWKPLSFSNHRPSVPGKGQGSIIMRQKWWTYRMDWLTLYCSKQIQVWRRRSPRRLWSKILIINAYCGVKSSDSCAFWFLDLAAFSRRHLTVRNKPNQIVLVWSHFHN